MVQRCDTKLSYLSCCPTFAVMCSITNNGRSCTVCKRSILRLQSRQHCKALDVKYQEQRLLNRLTAQKTRTRYVKRSTSLSSQQHDYAQEHFRMPIKHVECAIAPKLHHSDCPAQMFDLLWTCCHPHIVCAWQAVSMHSGCCCVMLRHA